MAGSTSELRSTRKTVYQANNVGNLESQNGQLNSTFEKTANTITAQLHASQPLSTKLPLKPNSATTTLTLSSLRVICVTCGKSRHPDEVACCLKTNALQEPDQQKTSKTTSRTNSVIKDDREDD